MSENLYGDATGVERGTDGWYVTGPGYFSMGPFSSKVEAYRAMSIWNQPDTPRPLPNPEDK